MLWWLGEQRPRPEPPCPSPAGAEPSPALLVPSAKRRSRKTSKDTGDSKDGGTPGSEEPGTKARGRGRKPSTKAKSGTLAPALPQPRHRGRCRHGGGLAADAGCRGVCAQRLRPPPVGTQLQGPSDPLIDWDAEAQGVSVHLPWAQLTPGQPSCSRQNPERGAKSRGCQGPLGGHHTWDDSDVRVTHPGPRAGSVQAQHPVIAEEAAGPAQKPGFGAREAPRCPDLT